MKRKFTFALTALLLLAAAQIGCAANAKGEKQDGKELKYEKEFVVRKNQNTVVAIFKHKMKKEDEQAGKVAAVISRGFEVALKHSADETAVLGTGVIVGSGELTAYYVKRETFLALQNKKITPQEFARQVSIKRFPLKK